MTSCTVIFAFRVVPMGFFPVWRQVFWQKRPVVRQQIVSATCNPVWQTITPGRRWSKPPCHISCRACKPCSAPRCLADFLVPRRHVMRQKCAIGVCVHRCLETAICGICRHDTLCGGALFGFLLAIKDVTALWRQQFSRRNDVNSDNQQKRLFLTG